MEGLKNYDEQIKEIEKKEAQLKDQKRRLKALRKKNAGEDWKRLMKEYIGPKILYSMLTIFVWETTQAVPGWLQQLWESLF